MKISIITVSFNSAATIRQTIESVLAQDYPALEYIVVDGASKDGTVEILKSFGDKIKFISEPDKGIYDAMNKGLKLATGDAIGTIGGDDFYPNNQIISEVAKAFIVSQADAVYGDIQFINPDDIHTIVRYWKAGEYSRENWLNGWMPPHLSFYLKKSAFEKYGNYITDFTCSGDYELMLRMLYKNKLSAYYLPLTLTTMRNGGTSTASLKHRYRANMEDRRAWRINNLKPHWYTLWMKPLSKIAQLFKKG
ncbi:glycosyltransferase family 2 protein [Arcicella rosea]|uniref:Glycosyltransferase involved in cell wall biosynthesis n=1 Tax=Arcicella rosea TaxID=502909 RepID=A0A841EBM5_9BACT|nr:glycosyltransferase family 2 protein [Arcicella rosea]MBB6001477.1 glycosyltransferase involved in cell wall biosynthesis [Arcicella rosea]